MVTHIASHRRSLVSSVRTFVCVASILLFTSAVLCQDLKSISSYLAGRISGSGKKTIAVVDFTDLQEM